jgi:hypothetical protein
MAAPIDPSLDPKLTVEKNQNLSMSDGKVSVKTAYFKINTGAAADTATMEVITKDPNDIAINDQIIISDQNAYYVEAIDKTPVKFGTGTPLVTQTTNIRFPKPEAKNYTPEKVATFLIFKK